MEPSKELIDQLYREQVLRARAMPPEEKVALGLRLFDRSCRIMADGIRDEFPDADEARVQEILRARLALARRLEQTPWQTR
jgi:hypothetical protein